MRVAGTDVDQARDLRGVADVHAVLQHAEVGDAALVEGDHLAVDQQVAVAERRRGEVGPGGGDVVVVAAGHAYDAVADVDEHAHAVPLDLVQPLRAGRDAVGLAGEHRAHACSLAPAAPQPRHPRGETAVGGDGYRRLMRAIWKGAVSFGLVSVPVKLYAATESHDVSFRQVHAKDGGRIKYQRVCSLDGEEVAYADIAKGYETEDGEMVILTDDDMAAAAVDVVAGDRGGEVRARASRSTRCSSRSPTTSSPRAPAPSPTRCCARR